MFPFRVAATPPVGDRHSILNAQRGATIHNQARNPLGSYIVPLVFANCYFDPTLPCAKLFAPRRQHIWPHHPRIVLPYFCPRSSSFFLIPPSFFLFPSSFFRLSFSFFLLPSSFFLLPSSFFLLPSSFFFLPSTERSSDRATQRSSDRAIGRPSDGLVGYREANRISIVLLLLLLPLRLF